MLCGQFGDSSLKNNSSWDIFELPNTVGIDSSSLRNTDKRDEPYFFPKGYSLICCFDGHGGAGNTFVQKLSLCSVRLKSVNCSSKTE